ncbi:serine O-acetyltransferase [Glaciecola siphonariae]
MWCFHRRLRRLEYFLNTKRGKFWKIIIKIEKYRFKKISKKLGFSIPPNVFGPGLCIPHYGTIVVNRKVRIGENCKIHTCTNIGADFNDPDSFPTLGNNCYIGPGAKLFGNIKIADGVKIGANAVVNKSCEVEGAVLLGVPAKIHS